MKRQNTRRQERAVLQAPAQLRWCGNSGDARFARGKIVNASELGVCVELGEPIRTCSFVQVDSSDLSRADWGGAVRHCEPKGIKFRIGLELTNRSLSN